MTQIASLFMLFPFLFFGGNDRLGGTPSMQAF